MAQIRPCADLRNKYNEISKICHETKKPVYITKNGATDLVILSDEAYEELESSKKSLTEEEVDRLISEKFDKHFANFEEFREDLFKHIEKARKDIEEGKGVPMEQAMVEMEAKYGIHK